MELRDYQSAAINSVLTKWEEFVRLLGVAPTGSGKTIKFAHIANARTHTDRVLVASVQTLARNARLQRFTREHFRTVIVDEAHRRLGESYLRILGYFETAQVLGVTATLDRVDRRSLGCYHQDIAFEIQSGLALSDPNQDCPAGDRYYSGWNPRRRLFGRRACPGP
jgi:superfamily II DNA or RNA helicase